MNTQYISSSELKISEFSRVRSFDIYIFGSRRSFETEQRKIYRGHDVIKNPVPKLCKLEDEMYRPPHEPMEAETCNKVSFTY